MGCIFLSVPAMRRYQDTWQEGLLLTRARSGSEGSEELAWKGMESKTAESCFLVCIVGQRVLQEATPCRPSAMPSMPEELCDFVCCAGCYCGLQFWGMKLCRQHSGCLVPSAAVSHWTPTVRVPLLPGLTRLSHTHVVFPAPGRLSFFRLTVANAHPS